MIIPDQWLLKTIVAKNFISLEKAKQAYMDYKNSRTALSLTEFLKINGYVNEQQLIWLEQQFKAESAKIGGVSDATHVFEEKQLIQQNQQNFGRYQIKRVIGQGNFGKVFLVYDPEWKRDFALKVLSAGSMADEATIKRFKREAQAISQLRHSNIVGVYEVGEEKTYHYFTMDFIEGQSLAEILKKENRLSARKAATLISKIAKAVAYSHSQNIVHRDIKPANIMISQEGEPFLTDFGTARAIRGGSRLSHTGNIIGTPTYMPPEQARGQNKQVDERSDIYSIGATFYEMLAGQVPFLGKNAMQVLMKVTNDAPTPPSEIYRQVPQDLENICLKCLEKDKQNRYASALEIVEDLEKFLEGKKVSVRISRPKWHKKIWTYKLHIAVVILLLALVYLIFDKEELSAQIQDLQATVKAREEKLAAEEALTKALDNKLAEAAPKKHAAEMRINKQEQELNKNKDTIKKLERQINELKNIKNLDQQLNASNLLLGGGMIQMVKLWEIYLFVAIGELPPHMRSKKEFQTDFTTAEMQVKMWSAVVSDQQTCRNFLFWRHAFLIFYQRYAKNREEQEWALKKAIELTHTAIDSEGSSDELIVMAYQMVDLIADHQEAHSIAKKCFDKLPSDEGAYGYFRRGCELRWNADSKGDKTLYNQSLLFLEKAIELKPNFAEAYSEIALVYSKQNNFREARAALNKSLKILPLSVSSFFAMIILNLEEAKRLFEKNDDSYKTYIMQAQQWYDLITEQQPEFTSLALRKQKIFQEWEKINPEQMEYFSKK